MNNFGYSIVAFILASLCLVYVLALRKRICEIMELENINYSKNKDSIRYFAKIFSTLRKNMNLNSYERRLLKQHLIFTFSFFFLYAIFIYFILFTKW